MPNDPNDLLNQAGDNVQWLTDLAITYGLKVLGAVFILLVGWFVAGWVKRLTMRASERAGLTVALSRFISQLARYALLVLTVIAMLSTVGIETTSFVAVLASAGFAVGLALQGTLGHFASGVLLLVFQPIKVGEYVSISGHDGTVDDIGLFATRLLTIDNRTVIIANSTVTSNTIVNFSRQGTRRASIAVGVAYGSDIDKVEQVCRGVTETHELVLSDKPVDFIFREMAASSINFEVRCWSKADDFLQVQHQVRSLLYRALIDNDIEIPFNQIVVHQAPTQ